MTTDPVADLQLRLSRFLAERRATGDWPQRLVVGFSAGLDSSVLLDALTALPPGQCPPVLAVHVHHGLQAGADAWAEQAQRFATARDVPIDVRRITVPAGASLEAQAREARRQAWREHLRPGDALVLAHHRDDQVETVLFRLARGTGIDGLAAMRPVSRPADLAVPVWRPLLGSARAELEAYAQARGLSWVDDPSNADRQYRRNWLRHELLPGFRAAMPSLDAAATRLADQAAEASELLAELAQGDLQRLTAPDQSLSLVGVRALSPARQRLLVRHWLADRGLPLPDSRVLARALTDLLTLREDAEPVVCWPGAELRRYRDRLYALSPQNPLPPSWSAPWMPPMPLRLPTGADLLTRPVVGQGLAQVRLQGRELSLRGRAGGERLRPQGQAHHRLLKLLFQEAGIPPWQREAQPLLWCGDELVAVPGYWLAEGWQAAPGEPGWQLALVSAGRGAASR